MFETPFSEWSEVRITQMGPFCNIREMGPAGDDGMGPAGESVGGSDIWMEGAISLSATSPFTPAGTPRGGKGGQGGRSGRCAVASLYTWVRNSLEPGCRLCCRCRDGAIDRETLCSREPMGRSIVGPVAQGAMARFYKCFTFGS